MMDTIYIRADANHEIGTGHVMRCVSIATEIRDKGLNVVFIVADHWSEKIVNDKGFSAICLDSQWNDLDKEITKMIELCKKKAIKKLLVDSYFVTENYLKELRKITLVVYIDDLNQFIYPVDYLINYNLFAEGIDYEKTYKDTGCDTKFLLGTSYVPLRKEFSICNSRKFSGINNILITSGGTDNYNMTSKILERLLKTEAYQNINIFCILGYFNINKDQLHKKYDDVSNVHLFDNVNNMSDYMKKCDICITAGGSTIYELCACGTPSIIYTIADNQLGAAKWFSRKDVIPWAGDIRDSMEQCINNIDTEIYKLTNRTCWEKRSKKMQKLVDGTGARRLAECIIDATNYHGTIVE